MNINLQDAVMFGRGRTEGRAQEQIEGNAETLQRSGDDKLTGQVILRTDPNALMSGVYQVWHETDRETWIWVDAEGVQHESVCPINDPNCTW